MNRRRFLGASIALAATPFHAGAQSPQVAPVVASFSILADMAGVIGGEAISVTSLVGPDGDPHDYQARPSDLLALRRAQVLIENGLGLEGWMARMARSSGFKGTRITAAAAVKPRSMQEGSHRITDPHAWQDPRNGVLYVRAIADGFSRAIPASAAAIKARASAYISQIEATDRWIEETLAPIPRERRKIITSHDAFGYFGARYGVTLHSAQGISTDAEPSASDMARLVAQIRREGIRAIFVENMTDPRIAAMLARESGAVLGAKVYSDALSPPSGPAPTYLAMFRHNVGEFARAMAAN